MNFIQTVEADAKAIVNFAEAETQTALTWLWGEAKPIFVAAAPTVLQGLLQELTSFLTTAATDIKGGTSDDIETAFLNALAASGHALLADAQTIGSNVLQMLIGLAKGKLAAA